ncbi:hypothetical protein EF918_29910, partial [Streptomyces sp. WAC06614]
MIMLTHNRERHEVDLGRHPRAEELLWRPGPSSDRPVPYVRLPPRAVACRRGVGRCPAGTVGAAHRPPEG